MPSTGVCAAKAPGRRHSVPVIYVRGTHYEIGYDIGRTFASLIHELVRTSRTLNGQYLPVYKTEKGRKQYEKTLSVVTERYPQYVREIQGTADGAQVEFHKLFLLHMDDVILYGAEHPEDFKYTGCSAGIGCSTVATTGPRGEILGHNEDAYSEVLTNWYIVSAHIVNDGPEERFASLCYAGHLPGYTSGYNHHGLIMSINTLTPKRLHPNGTPRHFLCRAILGVDNLVEAQQILRDRGSGAADGCSVNMTFLRQDGDRLFHNAEMAPSEPLPAPQESQLSVLTVSPGEHIIHTNTYLRLKIEEMEGPFHDNSNERLRVLRSFPPPETADDVIRMLGDQSGNKYWVYQDYDEPNADSVTIATGIFDCIAKTWSIYADNPKTTEPVAVIPILLKQY